MLGKLGELNEGYNVLTEMNGQCSDMLMDIGIYKMTNGKEELLFDNKNETAVLFTGRRNTFRVGRHGTSSSKTVCV